MKKRNFHLRTTIQGYAVFMPELPTPVLIHKTRLLKPKDGSESSMGDVILQVGRSRDRSEYAVWMRSSGPAGDALRPVVFTHDAQEAADRFNQQLEKLAEQGYPTDSEQMIDLDTVMTASSAA